ncbi:MAG: hypothetical protein AAF329_05500 [Cyanobacteria bacterium P01_A01_bin.17]
MIPVAHPSLNRLDAPVPQHPWPTGYIFQSPGQQFSYRVIGPCCRLYDREQLPWPCCRLQWHSKEPSWRRIGRRLVVDMATRRYASYCVELLNYGQPGAIFVMTLYTTKLTSEAQSWWCTRLKAATPGR